MGNLFNALNKLKTNIFGGPGNTGKTDPPATRVAKLGIKDTPTSLLEVDPLAFASFSYPRDITNNVQNGHYMLFYVNVQNRSKFQYNDAYGNSMAATKQVKVVTKKLLTDFDEDFTTTTKIVDVKGMGASEKVYYQNRAKKVTGTVYGKYQGLDVSLKSGIAKQQQRTGIGAKSQTTTRVSDSVAIYLPPNVQDNTLATYQDMATGMLGYAAATGLDFVKFMGNKDYEGAAKALTGGLGGFATEAGCRKLKRRETRSRNASQASPSHAAIPTSLGNHPNAVMCPP